MIEVTFIGTGSALPPPGRGNTCFTVRTENMLANLANAARVGWFEGNQGVPARDYAASAMCGRPGVAPSGSLTTIKTPRWEIGVRAAQMLLQLMRSEPVAEPSVDLGFELLARQSTAIT